MPREGKISEFDKRKAMH